MMTSSTHVNWPVTKDTLPAPPLIHAWDKPALFLDFDGTLVEIANHPDKITVNTSLPGILHHLNTALSGRLAIITGRSIADLSRHIDVSDIAIAGSHGGEFRTASSTTVEPLAHPLPEDVKKAVVDLSNQFGGLLIEIKPYSIAIHYRTLPEAGPEILSATTELADLAGLSLKPGKMVAELAMPGADKGLAVNHFMKTPIFDSARPLFIGDDITDEDAFRSVLNHNGGGVLVGSQRDTAALWRLPTVNDVHLWLKAALV